MTKQELRKTIEDTKKAWFGTGDFWGPKEETSYLATFSFDIQHKIKLLKSRLYFRDLAESKIFIKLAIAFYQSHPISIHSNKKLLEEIICFHIGEFSSELKKFAYRMIEKQKFYFKQEEIPDSLKENPFIYKQGKWGHYLHPYLQAYFAYQYVLEFSFNPDLFYSALYHFEEVILTDDLYWNILEWRNFIQHLNPNWYWNFYSKPKIEEYYKTIDHTSEEKLMQTMLSYFDFELVYRKGKKKILCYGINEHIDVYDFLDYDCQISYPSLLEDLFASHSSHYSKFTNQENVVKINELLNCSEFYQIFKEDGGLAMLKSFDSKLKSILEKVSV